MTVNSFTMKSNGGLFREIRTECEVFQPHDPLNITPTQRAALRSEKSIAVWDTGATGTVISQTLAQKLRLQPTGFAVINHAQGTSRVPKYIINIVLPNNVGFAFKEVTEGILSNCDVLIGMDIIAQGDFAITNVNGNTTFSFQLPSVQEIDFAASPTPVPPATKPIVKPKKVGRNDPCTCGSGKKYKNCCGK